MQSVPKIVRERLKAAPPAVNHPDADLLTAFAEQSLPEAERATMLDHLARCGDCRDVVALALPETEALETAVTPARSGWLTWPALRWGFVAAGVVVIAGLGLLQYQRRSATSMMAYKSPAVAIPESRAESSEPAPAAPVAQSAENHGKQDKPVATPSSAYSASGMPGDDTELQQIAPIAPPSAASKGHAFHGAARGAVGGRVGFGPKVPTQWQYNNNAQQQIISNAPQAPTAIRQADHVSAANAAKQVPGANQAATIEASGDAQSVTGRTTSQEASPRDQSADSQLSTYANSPVVAKAKLPLLAAPGQIDGYVVDPTGAVVSNARVTITPTTGASATAVTNSQGAWLIAGLPSGNYKAQAQAPGFRTSVLDLNYDANQPSTYRFTLSPGSVSETVEVSSEQSAVVQTEDAAVGGPITRRNAGQIPIKGSNFTQLTPPSTGSLPRWTISATGVLQRSFDQGNSWQTVDVNANPASFTSIEVVTKTSRAKEKDADKKALKRDAATPTFRAVAAAGSEVWAGGSNGALYHSLDAGSHWVRVVPTSTGSMLTGDIIGLEFPDPQHGKITTSTPEVWTTSDAGQTWQIH